MNNNRRYHRIIREPAEKYGAPNGEPTNFLSTAEETDGKITVMDSYFPNGSGVPWHIHTMDEELFLVIAGKYQVGVGDEAGATG